MNQLISDVLLTLLVINIISTIIFIFVILSDRNIDSSAHFVNPIVIYKIIKVNWFGAYFIAIIHNICCIIPAVCYWMYKICTVGRK